MRYFHQAMWLTITLMISAIMAFMIFTVMTQPVLASDTFTEEPIESAYTKRDQTRSSYLYRTDVYRYSPVTKESKVIRKGHYRIYTPGTHSVEEPGTYNELNPEFKYEPYYQNEIDEIFFENYDN